MGLLLQPRYWLAASVGAHGIAELRCIHVFTAAETWMPGTYAKTRLALLPGMTNAMSSLRRLQDEIIPVGALHILRSEDIFGDAPF
jgi:hypothetical protein